MRLNRRQFAKLATSLGLLPALPAGLGPRAYAQEPTWRHGLSLFGELKYGADFMHFDYVKPDAPKAGRVRLSSVGSFDNLNPYTFKGDPFGGAANNETLLSRSLDEASAEYELIAEAVHYPEDYSSATYRLRPEARFHDGKPITVDDVIWSLSALKGAHPFYNAYYANIASAEPTGENEVTFRFSEKGNRELPQISGQLPILPKHWWTGTDANGKARDINATTLEIPLGSGPYRATEVKPGEFVRLERVKDYWGEKLPVNVGQNNFDEITYVFFKDQIVAHEAFKAGQYDYRLENSAKQWATGYDFPAAKQGDVVLEKIKTKNGTGMQSFAFNLRRAKFQDARVRQAFNLAFNFEWSNENLFFGQYKRSDSYFSNSELASTGLLADPLEIEILESVKDQVPGEVFSAEYKNPVSGNPTEQRNNLRQAARLLQQAGFEQKLVDGKTVLVAKSGETFNVEFTLNSPLFERIVLPYTQELAKLGIVSTVRTVDSAQYQERVRNFDFDIVVGSFAQSLSPGNEQRDYWGSEAAKRPGSRNILGIENPAIDKLIDRLIFAKSREELVAACRALDRVLLWNHYVVPMWHIPYERIAYWNRFSKPEKLPDFSVGFPTIWWFDADKDAKIGKS